MARLVHLSPWWHSRHGASEGPVWAAGVTQGPCFTLRQWLAGIELAPCQGQLGARQWLLPKMLAHPLLSLDGRGGARW